MSEFSIIIVVYVKVIISIFENILLIEFLSIMKKSIISSFVIFQFVSCSESKKGAWCEEDKKMAKDFIKQSEVSIHNLGIDKQQFFDCYLEKVENSFENFDEASSDSKQSDMLVNNCLEEILLIE